MINWTNELASAFLELGRAVITAVPALLFGLFLATLALLLAWIAQWIVVAIARRPMAQHLFQHIHARTWLERIGVKSKPERFVGRVMYWVLVLLFVRTVADAMGLAPVSSAVGTLLGYVPNLLAAGVVIMVGSVVARLIYSLVRQTLQAAGPCRGSRASRGSGDAGCGFGRHRAR